MAATSRAHSASSKKAAEQAAQHRERLRQALPDTVTRLQQRHADQIDAKDIEDYVALNWLEWHGGGLRLTITGRNVRAQLATTAT
jgi:hypothetical protein